METRQSRIANLLAACAIDQLIHGQERHDFLMNVSSKVRSANTVEFVEINFMFALINVVQNNSVVSSSVISMYIQRSKTMTIRFKINRHEHRTIDVGTRTRLIEWEDIINDFK